MIVNTQRDGSGISSWLKGDSLGNLADPRVPKVVTAAPGTPPSMVLTVPATKLWVVQSLWAMYTADVAVGNRTPIIKIADTGPVDFFVSIAGTAITASQIVNLSYMAGVQPAAPQALYQIVPIPPNLKLPAGYTITIDDAAGISAADIIIFLGLVNEYEAPV